MITAEMIARKVQEQADSQARTTPEVIALARVFHRLAFSKEECEDRGFYGNFHPAPIYLHQALAVLEDPAMWTQLQDCHEAATK